MQRILGQEHAVGMLSRALNSTRFHHAWIFSGPKGVGKCTTAVDVARLLLDPEARQNLAGIVESDPSSECNRLIDAKLHPDFHLIYKELALHSENPELRKKKLTNIPIDLLRERMVGGQTRDGRWHDASVYLRAVRGHNKVFIIDEAELVDSTGQNAILKTLEEPPLQTFIFLVTSQPQRLLPTIQSRCQHVKFTLLNAEAMSRWFEQSGLSASGVERAWLEHFADGSPGKAQVAAEYGFYKWHVALRPMLAELSAGKYPQAMGESMGDMVEEFASAWVKKHDNASKTAANIDGVQHMLALLAHHAREQLGDAIARGDDPEAAMRIVVLLRECGQQVQAHVNFKQMFHNLVAQWCERDASLLV